MDFVPENGAADFEKLREIPSIKKKPLPNLEIADFARKCKHKKGAKLPLIATIKKGCKSAEKSKKVQQKKRVIICAIPKMIHGG